MSGQTIPIHTKTSIPTENDLFSFDAFNFAPGQDQNIRWLSRPNEKFFSEILSKDAEKFRVQFDAENFRPEQIKVNRRKSFVDRFDQHVFLVLIDLHS